MSVDRPTWTKVQQKTGGEKVCPKCRKRHKAVMWVEGRAIRPKTCLKCGAKLPAKLTRHGLQWCVREFDPATGQTRDIPADSGLAADDLIRAKERDWTADATKAVAIDKLSAIVRGLPDGLGIHDIENRLIEVLGGDPRRRKLIDITWDEAVENIIADIRLSKMSDDHADAIWRVARFLKTVSGLDKLADVTLDTIREYRRVRLAGGWTLDGKPRQAVTGPGMNADLRNLSALFKRAKSNNYIVANPLIGEDAADLTVKTDKPDVPYMPDAVLEAFIREAKPVWFQVLVVLSYYLGPRIRDILRLEWSRDIDLEGTRTDAVGMAGPKVWIKGYKRDTPHWMPLAPAAVEALRRLRAEPVIDARVFPVRESHAKRPETHVSRLWKEARERVKPTLPADMQVCPDGRGWELNWLRKKSNTDLGMAGANEKERMAFLGHKTLDVNQQHYLGLVPERLRSIADSLPVFKLA